MKVVIPLLILMSLLITEAGAQTTAHRSPPTNVKATPGDRQITITWEPPENIGALTVNSYEPRYRAPVHFHGSVGVAGGASARSVLVTQLQDQYGAVYRIHNGTPYDFLLRVRYNDDPSIADFIIGDAPIVTVTPMIPAPTGLTATFDEPTTGERTATLRWTEPSSLYEPITGYQYSPDGGAAWTPTGSTRTSHTVTGLENGVEYSFRVRAVRGTEVPGRAAQTGNVTLEAPRKRRRVIQDCPVGWTRSDGFAGRNRRVLIYEVKLDMDFQNRVSIYKPVWVAIYVHPDEGLENLEGWKLQVAVPYNRHRDYQLTAENSVVVDAGFVEGGFAFIENPEENPFPITGIGFVGSPAPGFDYRLYDDTGRRIDFGISCYKRFDIFQVLKDLEDPRVLRNVSLEDIDWNAAWFIRSEWTVPMPAPAAPSLVKKSVVGTWADLKKQ